jgi:hypothetical protein
VYPPTRPGVDGKARFTRDVCHFAAIYKANGWPPNCNSVCEGIRF